MKKIFVIALIMSFFLLTNTVESSEDINYCTQALKRKKVKEAVN